MVLTARQERHVGLPQRPRLDRDSLHDIGVDTGNQIQRRTASSVSAGFELKQSRACG
jgi:hypothetical protein